MVMRGAMLQTLVGLANRHSGGGGVHALHRIATVRREEHGLARRVRGGCRARRGVSARGIYSCAARFRD